jgi:hypothetical protein
MHRKKNIPLLLILSVFTLNVWAGDNEEAVKQVVKNYYDLYFVKMDKQAYRSILTEDYLLLENGEILDTEGDIAAMPDRDSGYKRTDSFDFRLVKIEGDIAWAVYFLKSEIADRVNGIQHKEWLESAVLHRSDAGWKIALLHSTKIAQPRQ